VTANQTATLTAIHPGDHQTRDAYSVSEPPGLPDASSVVPGYGNQGLAQKPACLVARDRRGVCRACCLSGRARIRGAGAGPRDGRAQLAHLTDRGWDVVTVGTRLNEEIESAWAQLRGAQRRQELRATLKDLMHT
jgi:hypothetical protein